MGIINIHQVYFDEESKENCDPAWNHYDNSYRLTEYFENQVIADLLEKGEHYKTEYFAVFSHDVNLNINFREDNLPFSPDNLETIVQKYKVDCFSFQKRRRQENIVVQAEQYHHGFIDMTNKILKHCGMGELPAKLDKIVLFNLMVCNQKFWDAYYEDLLKPAMEIMKEMPELMQDSKYALIGRPMTVDKAERFKKAFGNTWYPYHPFVCERLASIYLQLHPEFSFRHIF